MRTPDISALDWRIGWDGKAHAFHDIGPEVAEALCTHSIRTSKLGDYRDSAEKCWGCLVMMGQQIPDTAKWR